MALIVCAQSMSSCVQNAIYLIERIRTLFVGSTNSLHHAYLTTVDNGTYTLKEMLKPEDKNEFITEMMKVVQDQKNTNHWTMIPRADMPDSAKTIIAGWFSKERCSLMGMF